MSELTPHQLRALAWIRDFPCSSAEWRAGERAASGNPKNWDRIRLSGKESSITIMTPDWQAIMPLFEPAPFGQPSRLYQLNEMGHAALAPPPKEA